MPLLVRDFEWSQTEDAVVVVCPLKGFTPTAKQGVDIFTTSAFVKITFPPFICEIFPLHEINVEKSLAIIETGLVKMTLVKAQLGVKWEQLQDKEILADKQRQMEVRKNALDEEQKRLEMKQEEKSKWKNDQHHSHVKTQMKIEQEGRDSIERTKEQIKSEAMEDVEEFKEKQAALQQKQRELNNLKQFLLKRESNKAKPVIAQSDKDIFTDVDKIKEEARANIQEDIRVRTTGKIKVNFTERAFPTPARESAHEKEQEWLKRQLDARKATAIEGGNTIESADTLKQKGIDYLTANDVGSAINVFNHAIKHYPKNPAFHSNRALCHLKSGNHYKCIEDTSKALELLMPETDSNRAARLRSHVRRGTSFCHMHLFVEALADYEKAMTLDPDNEGLRKDAENVRQLIQTGTSYYDDYESAETKNSSTTINAAS